MMTGSFEERAALPLLHTSAATLQRTYIQPPAKVQKLSSVHARASLLHECVDPRRGRHRARCRRPSRADVRTPLSCLRSSRPASVGGLRPPASLGSYGGKQ